jgi:hypothetical protein
MLDCNSKAGFVHHSVASIVYGEHQVWSKACTAQWLHSIAQHSAGNTEHVTRGPYQLPAQMLPIGQQQAQMPSAVDMQTGLLQ